MDPSLPNLLITNDDGFQAEGIQALCRALKGLGNLFVVAPKDQQSAKSLSLSISRPLTVHSIEMEGALAAWSVDGTPADCVKLAISKLLPHSPHLIVSGINHGSNAGRNVLYSGTVGGVIEGVLRGIPGLALSSTCLHTPNFHLCTPLIPSLISYALDHPLSQGTFLNCNFPSDPEKGIQGLKLARQGKQYWIENPLERETPIGTTYYWLGHRISEHPEEEDSDIHYLSQGYATAVPVHVGELTDMQALQERKGHFEKLLSF